MEVGGRKEVSHPLSPTHRHITPAADNQWASSTQPQQNIKFSIKAKFGLISIAWIVFSTSKMGVFLMFFTDDRTLCNVDLVFLKKSIARILDDGDDDVLCADDRGEKKA